MIFWKACNLNYNPPLRIKTGDDEKKYDNRRRRVLLLYSHCDSLIINGNPKDFTIFSFSELFPLADSMEALSYVDPSLYDLLLTDVKEQDLYDEIAKMLQVEYLQPQEEGNRERSDITGILFGPNCRPVLNLVVETTRFRKAVNIIFIVDTGSPSLFISENAMRALGFNDFSQQVFQVKIGGHVYEANQSHSHFADVNLIGASFLARARALLLVDYKDLKVELKFS